MNDRPKPTAISVAVPSGVGCGRCGCRPRAALDILCSSCRRYVDEKESHAT
jgi:hypothetical protein